MAVRGPVVSAVVAVGGLVGMMTVNSVGGLVVDDSGQQATSEVAATASETPTEPPTQPPTETQPPPETTEVPPTTEVETTEPAPPDEPAPFPAEAVYAGEVDGGPMTIAVAVKGEQAAAYLCDGANVESWLQGTARDGRLDVRSKDGTNRVVATLDGRDLTGTATVAGQELPFTAGEAKAPAGLYRGEGAEATIGWIVLPDGTQVGIATGPGGSEPAPRLNPERGAVTLDGRRVVADEVAGDTTF
ncbi:hypothetical protein [Actinophytocola gossypii]|uniref:Serine/threonine protein kinase n=1 Tax=Actinophytocola gossypii TaxID=2812003 RepID=A0ABT2J1C1_9PSEU|nr:hypothetical protein [Actinophytocola gossypii]MCT2581660.1 hypothetical protein [Actinophytocola gossypii]